MTAIDLVVAGAGAAGISAALAAAERGLDVVLLEANEHFRHGSNTAMSTSMVPAGGSRWQAERGIEDSPEQFLGDIMRKTGEQADEVLARALTEVAPELVVWLAVRWGVPLDLVTDFRYPGHSADRCHAVPDRSGTALHARLLDGVASTDNITLAVPVRLADLSPRDRGGIDVHVTTPSGDSDRIDARAVVLATNGFGADSALVRELLPEIAEGVYHGGEGSTGDALRIGRSLGLDTAYLDAYQGHGSLATPHGILLTWAFVMHGGVLVNVEGRRFGDETTGYSEFGPRVVAQPGSVAWAVYDERVHEALAPFKDYRDVVEAGAVDWADDVEAAAQVVGAPVEQLRDTLEAADRASRGVAADPHGRTAWEGPLGRPLAVVKVTGALFHTQGGLEVDGRGRVLRGGTPVPGLYAAGGAAHGISGHGADGYLAGNGLLSALGLGYLAGRDAGGRS